MNKGASVIKILIFIVLLLVALSMLGVSVQDDIVGNEQVQENSSYVLAGIISFWENILQPWLSTAWSWVTEGNLWEWAQNASNEITEPLLESVELPE